MISWPSELARTASVKYLVTEDGFAIYCGYNAGFMLRASFIRMGSYPIGRMHTPDVRHVVELSYDIMPDLRASKPIGLMDLRTKMS